MDFPIQHPEAPESKNIFTGSSNNFPFIIINSPGTNNSGIFSSAFILFNAILFFFSP